jgi:hypothetical protein
MTLSNDPFGRNHSAHEVPPKKPEYVIIEGPYEEPKGDYTEPFESSGPYGNIPKMDKVQYPLVVRFIAVLAAFCALGWVIGCIISGSIFFFLAAITLFKVKSLNKYARRTWSFFKTAMIGFISAVIAIFSPPLGIGLFIMFFALRNEVIENSLFQSIVKNHFKQG